MKTQLILILVISTCFGFAQNFNTYNYNTQNSDMLWDVVEYDSGYLLTGFSQDSSLSVTYNTYAEPVLIKLSKTGTPIDTLVTSGFGYTELNLFSVYNGGFFYTFGVTNPPNDSFRLFVTKYDTLFNLVHREEYPQLQDMYFRQLHKTKEMTDSSMYLIGHYMKTASYSESFILNYNFNTMKIDLYKELPISCIITDALVDDTSYLCTMAYYNSGPGLSTIVRYDTALNLLSVDTIIAIGFIQNNLMNPYFTINHYRDSLYICTGQASIIKSTSTLIPPDYSSLVAQTYNSNFDVIDQKYWYYDSLVNVEPLYNNSFVANGNNEYFIGITLNIDMYYPDKGIMIAKADSNLNTIWKKHIPCTSATMRAMNILPTDDGGVLVLYWEQTSLGGAELMNSKLMKIGSNGEVTSIINLGKSINQSVIKIFPNPTTNEISISLVQTEQQIKKVSIIDLQGKKIIQKQINAKQTKLDVSNLSKGIYILEGSTNTGKRFSRKFVKE